MARNTYPGLRSIYPDNSTGEISPEDLRALVDTLEPFEFAGAPTANDDVVNTSGRGLFDEGSAWLDTSTNPRTLYICKNATATAAVWQEVGAGGGGSGETVEKSITQTSHGFSVGNVVRHNGTNYVAATADTAANAEAVGVVTAVADANTFTLTTHGFVSTLSGLTAGSVYFLQNAGGLGTTEGTISKPMLVATSATGGVLLNYRGLNNGTLTAARLVETVTTIAASGTSQTLDLSAASIFDITLTDACTLSFSNVPSGGFGVTFILKQDATGSRTVTWPAGFKWPGGTAPTLSTAASAQDVITAFTPDSGTTWYGFTAGLAMA